MSVPLPLPAGFPAPETTSWAPRDCSATGGVLDDIPEGERVQAFFLGQLPAYDPALPKAIEYPSGLSTDAMFAEVSSQYVDPTTGISYTVPCYIPGAEAKVNEIVCPEPFVAPLFEKTPQNCIQPCPVPAYTEEEYTTMWTVSSAVGACGFALNVFMAATWWIGGKRYFKAIPFQLKACVIGGVVYGRVCILCVPQLLFLTFDMSSSCDFFYQGQHITCFNTERRSPLRVRY